MHKINVQGNHKCSDQKGNAYRLKKPKPKTTKVEFKNKKTNQKYHFFWFFSNYDIAFNCQIIQCLVSFFKKLLNPIQIIF